MDSLKSKYIVFWLTSILIILILLNITLNKRIGFIDINAGSGLLNELHFYWIICYLMIIIITIYFIFKSRNKLIFIINIIILTLVLFGTPILIEELPRDHDSYWHMSNTITVVEEKTIDIDLEASSNRLLTYNKNFNKDYLTKNSGGPLIYATLYLLSGIEIDKFIRYVPLILVLLINITLYIFFKTLFNEQNAQIATIIAILSNIYIHFHFAPATLGIFFILLIFWSINKEIRKNLIIIIIVGSAILLINIPSYIIIILTSLFLFLIGVIKKEKPKIDVICILILTLLGILYLSHNNYFSNLVLKGIIEKILQKGIQEANFGLITINRYIRICILSIMVFISLYVIYKILKEKKKLNIILSLFLTSFIIFIFTVFISGNFNLDDRAYLVFIWGFTIGSLALYNMNKRKLFLTLIIFLAVINGLTLYANENLYLVNKSVTDSWNFLVDNTEETDKILASLDYYPTFLYKRDRPRQTEFQFTEIDNDFLINKKYRNYNYFNFNSKIQYVQKSKNLEENYLELMSIISENNNKIYTNKDSEIYQLIAS